MVIIKAVHVESSEWRIISYLSTGARRKDPRNHTIPLVEIIHAGEYVFIVQACWDYSWGFPPFDSVKSRLEWAHQLLTVKNFYLAPLSARVMFHRASVSCASWEYPMA